MESKRKSLIMINPLDLCLKEYPLTKEPSLMLSVKSEPDLFLCQLMPLKHVNIGFCFCAVVSIHERKTGLWSR